MPKLDKPVPVERRIFSTNFRASRRLAGMTLQQVSDTANISVPFISMVESGNQNVTVSSMAELSHAVQVPLYILLSPSYKPESFEHGIWKKYVKKVQEVMPQILEQQLLAENARHYRKLAGLTQAQVDKWADFREGTTTDIERQTGNMSIDVIAPLAPVLGIPFFKLFEPN